MRMTAGQEVEKIETRLRQLGTKIDQLAAQAADIANDTQVEYQKQINHIKDKHTVVRDKLQTFRAAGGQKWESFKGSIGLAWQDLEHAFKAVRQGPPPPVSVALETEVAPKSED
jgi:hypothetical protein